MIEEVKILTQKVYGLKLLDAKRFPARYSILPKGQSRIAEMGIPQPQAEGGQYRVLNT